MNKFVADVVQTINGLPQWVVVMGALTTTVFIPLLQVILAYRVNHAIAIGHENHASLLAVKNAVDGTATNLATKAAMDDARAEILATQAILDKATIVSQAKTIAAQIPGYEPPTIT
jgi:hypothetical protein